MAKKKKKSTGGKSNPAPRSVPQPDAASKNNRETTRTPMEFDEEQQKVTNLELILGNEKYVTVKMLEAVTSNQFEMIKLLREIRDRLPEPKK